MTNRHEHEPDENGTGLVIVPCRCGKPDCRNVIVGIFEPKLATVPHPLVSGRETTMFYTKTGYDKLRELVDRVIAEKGGGGKTDSGAQFVEKGTEHVVFDRMPAGMFTLCAATLTQKLKSVPSGLPGFASVRIGLPDGETEAVLVFATGAVARLVDQAAAAIERDLGLGT